MNNKSRPFEKSSETTFFWGDLQGCIFPFDSANRWGQTAPWGGLTNSRKLHFPEIADTKKGDSESLTRKKFHYS